MPQAASPLIDVQLLDHPVWAIDFDPFPQPAGAECIFLGRTRIETHPEHGVLERLEYDAYRPLAHNTLINLAQEAIEKHQCLAVRLHHAIGRIPPGQASVLVQVVASHRSEAFDACRFLIDQLKAQVPIWKKESWADGSTWSGGTPVQMDRAP